EDLGKGRIGSSSGTGFSQTRPQPPGHVEGLEEKRSGSSAGAGASRTPPQPHGHVEGLEEKRSGSSAGAGASRTPPQPHGAVPARRRGLADETPATQSFEGHVHVRRGGLEEETPATRISGGKGVDGVARGQKEALILAKFRKHPEWSDRQIIAELRAE